jgi:hypothetical protein
LQRNALIQDGKPSPELTDVLKSIFSMYAKGCQKSGDDELTLDIVKAGQLWYRCGMKLSCLDTYFTNHRKDGVVVFEDFMDIIRRIISEDVETGRRQDEALSGISVGDRVELAESYETKGDAVAGPLQPGDRGTVVEVQQGPSGEMHSVRVLHGGRRVRDTGPGGHCSANR